MAAASEERAYRASAQRLYNAVLRTVSQLGYSIQHSDAAARTISFNTGFSMRSYAGQDMTATVIEDTIDASTVIVGGRRAQKGSITSGGGQIYDWGERGKITRKFFEALDPIVQKTPEPPQIKSPSQELSVDALERLTRLRESGALSDQEFQAAKAKLLNSNTNSSDAPLKAMLLNGAAICARVFGDGQFAFPVVGESHHQDALLAIVGARTADSCEKYHAALLLPEPTNPYDPHAVEVIILRKQVGYLARDVAPKFLQALEAGGFDRAAAESVITGGWHRIGEPNGFFGVKLNAALPFDLRAS